MTAEPELFTAVGQREGGRGRGREREGEGEGETKSPTLEAPFTWGRRAPPPPREGGQSASTSWTRHLDSAINPPQGRRRRQQSRAGTGFSARGRGRPAYLALVRLRAGDIERNPGPGLGDAPARAADRAGRRQRRSQREGEPGDLKLMQFNCNGV